MGGGREAGHGIVEDRREIGVLGEVVEDRHAVGLVEPRLADRQAVKDLVPGAVVPRIADPERHGAQRTRGIAQQLADRREREARLAPRDGGEDSEARERSQQTPERGGVIAGRGRQLGGGPGPVGELVGEPQPGGRIDGARDELAGDHLEQGERRRHGLGKRGIGGGGFLVHTAPRR